MKAKKGREINQKLRALFDQTGMQKYEIKKIRLVIFLLLSLIFFLYIATPAFCGCVLIGSGGNWSDRNNWNCDGQSRVPSSVDDIIIGAGRSVYVDVNVTNGGRLSLAGVLYFGNDITFNNGGMFEVLNDAYIGDLQHCGGKFENFGTFVKTGYSNTSSNVCFNEFINEIAGSVQVESGELVLKVPSIKGKSEGGSFSASGGTQLVFYGGTFNMDSASSITGDGTVEFRWGHVYLDGNYNVTGITKVTAGWLTVTGHVNSFGRELIVTNAGILELNTGASVNVSAMTQDGGVLTGTDTVTITGKANWSNGTMSGAGSTEIASGAVMNITGAYAALDKRTLKNAGETICSGNLALQNGAVVNNLEGAIFDLRTDNSIDWSIGSPPTFNNYGLCRKSAGTTSTVRLVFNNSGTVDSQSGRINFLHVFNNLATGVIGSPLSGLTGSVRVPGNLPLAGTNILNIDIGGRSQGAQYDYLIVPYSATLGGTLNVNLVNGFIPDIGDSFTIMSYGWGRTGSFNTVNLPPLPSCRTWKITYDPTSMTLSVQFSCYTVTPVAGVHGALQPSTPQSVNLNQTVSFAVVPDIGYHISSVTGCGGSIAGTTYTTGAISADCTVSASFDINSYSITASAGANGSVSPSGTVSVNHGGAQSFSIIPDSNYHVQNVLVDGVSVGAVTSYAFNDVTRNHTISTTFALNNEPPMADAGPDRIFETVSTSIHLDGTSSSDPDGDPITYQWSFISKPDGSNVTFDDPSSATPSFTVDRLGEYVVSLAVTDSFGMVSSDEMIVQSKTCKTIQAENSRLKLYACERRITFDSTSQVDAAISGDLIVWTYFQGGDIGYYDLKTSRGSAAKIRTSNGTYADISNDLLVYTDIMTDDIYVCSAQTVECKNLTSAANSIAFDSKIDGEIVVWIDDRDGNHEIYSKNLSTGEERRITNSSNNDDYPAVNKGIIVWQSCTTNWVGCDIFAYEWSSGITKQITKTPEKDEILATISGNRIVYETLQERDFNICVYDFTTEIEICPMFSQSPHYPIISGDFVSFRHFTEKNHIDLWHAPTNSVFQLTDAGYKYLTDIDGNRIVYIDYPDWQRDIYLLEFNILPVADVAPVQAAHVGQLITLDGSRSSDTDNNYPLSFAWAITGAPAGSMATLADADTVSPSFRPDVPGNYTVTLVVTDSEGLASDPVEVTVSTYNTAPIADAGPDQALSKLGRVYLDGSRSYDDDGDPITYKWTIAMKPAGSNASLSNSTSSMPTFVADRYGDYVITLVVTDSFGAASEEDSVTASFANVKPVSNAGDNQSVPVGTLVSLDGSGSSDANEDPLTFKWSIVSRPVESIAVLGSENTVLTSFIPDKAGTYVIGLIVNDGTIDSEPSNVTVTATSTKNQVIDTLNDAMSVINELNAAVFKNPNMQNALTNKINAVLKMVDDGLYKYALDKLENDILQKTDGCATTGKPDKNDWITNCPAQQQVYPLIIQAIELLRAIS